MKHDLLFIGMEDWDGVWRRSQNLIARLAKRNPDKKILFIESPFGIANAFKRGKFSEVKSYLNRIGVPRQIEGFNNVFAMKPIVRWPVSWLSMKPRDESYVRAQVHKAANYIAMGSRYLWIKPYYGAHFMGKMNEVGTLYDVGDDWTVSITNPKLKAEAIREDDFLTKNADQVVVVSDFLYQKKSSQRATVHLISNGANIDLYSKIGTDQIPVHPLVKDLPKPIWGHTGTLDSRINIDLVLSISKQFPDATLLFVGPINIQNSQLERLKACPNIVIHGPIDHYDLPSVMQGFDACIVPRHVEEFTESQNPLKLWEYLASGLPIVTTATAGFRSYPNLCYIAQDSKEFIGMLNHCCKESALSKALRKKEALKHTWDLKLDQIENILSKI